MTIFGHLGQYGKGPAPLAGCRAILGFDNKLQRLFTTLQGSDTVEDWGVSLPEYRRLSVVNRAELARWLGNLLAPKWEVQEDWPANRIGCLFKEPIPVYVVMDESPSLCSDFLATIAATKSVLLFCDGNQIKQTSWRRLLEKHKNIMPRAIEDFITFDAMKKPAQYVCSRRDDFMALAAYAATKNPIFVRVVDAPLDRFHMVLIPDDRDRDWQSAGGSVLPNEWICSYYVDGAGTPISDSYSKVRAMDFPPFVNKKVKKSVDGCSAYGRSKPYEIFRKFAASNSENNMIPTGRGSEQAARSRLKSILEEHCALAGLDPFVKGHRTEGSVGLAFHLSFSRVDAMEKIGFALDTNRDFSVDLPPSKARISKKRRKAR